jgi:vacuolar-type H+-ATPase subunit I/STV1
MQEKHLKKKCMLRALLIGFAATLLGFFWQILSITNSFDSIELGGSITPEHVKEAICNSFIPLHTGVGVLLILLTVCIVTLIRKAKGQS